MKTFAVAYFILIPFNICAFLYRNNTLFGASFLAIGFALSISYMAIKELKKGNNS